MKSHIIFKALPCALALLALTHGAHAIKITVPEQYKDQVEAIKEAERKERRQELEGVAESAEGGIQIAGEEKPEAEKTPVDADEFLVQSVVEAEATAASFEGTLAADEGIVSGQVVDKETGQPISGAAIIIEGTDIATVTAEDGRYSLGPAPAGTYTLSFIKGGYIEANITEYTVAGGEVSVFPFAMPPRPAGMSDEVYVLQDFSVSAEEASQMMLALDLRMDSDSIMNVMTADDFSRFAASDVGDAIKRVAGITVEGGQFAVIRGLDERYSSTTLNGAPVPSPDPDRQSVPLDLFPSDIVSNLTVSKTFTPELPGNSAGGAINILTNTYPEEWMLEVGVKTGFNDRATDQFLERQGPAARGLNFSQSAGEIANSIDFAGGGFFAGESEAGQELEFSLKTGGTTEWMGRTLKVLFNAGVEKDYETLQGFEESRFARGGRSIAVVDPSRPGGFRRQTLFIPTTPPIVRGTGDLARDELPGTSGRFDLTESEKSERQTFLFSSEIDIDRDGEHRVGLTYFRNQQDSDIASLRSNGQFGFDPNIPEPVFVELTNLKSELFSDLGSIIGSGPDRLQRFLDLRIFESNVLRRERDLEVLQASGFHEPLNKLEGLKVDWVVSLSDSSQLEKDVATTQALFNPATGEFFTGATADVNQFQPSFAWRNVFESQDFGKLNASYSFDLGPDIKNEFGLGIAAERTDRDTEQFVARVRFNGFANVLADNMEDSIRPLLSGPQAFVSDPLALAEGTREVDAFYLSNKVTFFDKLDLMGGVRFEKVVMTTSTNQDGSSFFNSELFRGSANLAARINAQILGFNDSQPLPDDFVGEINEDVALPSIGLTYRPFEGARLSLAYSETLVRPSFKEFTELTTQNPITLDFEGGNPTLTTSDVRSADFRAEYSRPNGDLIAVALFYKEIDNPIEKTNLFGSVDTDVFFNNENTAEIKGVEFELRKSLDFLGANVAEYFSIGGNVALIDATVDIPDAFQQFLSGGLDIPGVGTIGGGALANHTGPGINDGAFLEAPTERQLFQQPEWIFNTDLTFEQPDWGTRATLSFFSQSEVLDKAAGFGQNQTVTVDEFQMSFEEINFTLSQRLTDNLSLGFGVKNLTDSERGIKYDDSVGGASKRSYKVGRSYSISITGTF